MSGADVGRGDVSNGAAVVSALRARGETLAVAESLTGGLLCSRLVDVPGASAVLRGGVVAYATDLKALLLGVDADLLLREGAVHPLVAAQMARGVADRLGAVWGVATTGVAGPDPQDGRAPGTVHVAVGAPGGARGRTLHLGAEAAGPDGRSRVRLAAVDAALDLLLETVREHVR